MKPGTVTAAAVGFFTGAAVSVLLFSVCSRRADGDEFNLFDSVQAISILVRSLCLATPFLAAFVAAFIWWRIKDDPPK
jgi:energy-converting hydrogenase Eha subunit G